MPKHLAPLVGRESLLQLTARRLLALAPAERLIVVAAKNQDLLIRTQLAAIDPDLAKHRLLEPAGRNTAAAIALAALEAKRLFGPEAVLWVCPSDHLMRDEAALARAVEQALPAAAAGDLVTFGIDPTRPETGYGYIRAGAPLGDGAAVRRVERFVEKPELRAAEAMLREGGYYWNSGMFLFRADRILEELARHEPEIATTTEAAFRAATVGADGGLEPPDGPYRAIPSQPIDKAVMERAERIAVVVCDPAWTDLGSWHAIWEESEKDEAGNAGRGDVLLHDTRDCLIHAGDRLVACAGLRDLAVIETRDAVLIADRRSSEPIKLLVGRLNQDQRSEAIHHTVSDHAWGRSLVLEEDEACRIRRLELAPGARLEGKLAEAAAIRWTVTAGRLMVAEGEQVLALDAGDSADSVEGSSYRLSNPATDGTAKVIEITLKSIPPTA
jgi:mannose-1-phosphate guanylyltransferase/mannose-6-phosphate isomerase